MENTVLQFYNVEKTYTIEEISKLTKKSIKFIRREVAKGSLKSIGTKKIAILEKDFVEWKKIEKDDYVDYTNETKNLNHTQIIDNNITWTDITENMSNINAWTNKNDMSKFNFIDLFAGAGGLSCGMVMAGFNPIASIEIMPEAVQTYNYNFSKFHKNQDRTMVKDIRLKETKQELIDFTKNKHIHLICGGFPCQGFSMAGNRIVTDPRNSLYLDMLDIVTKIKPDVVVMENVEGLRSMMNGQIERKIISDYENIGYKINVTVLNSADYGVAQFRKRVIFIANRIGLTNAYPKPIYSKEEYKTVGDAIGKLENIPEDPSINHVFTKHSVEIVEKIKKLSPGQSLYKNYSDAWKRVDWNLPSTTVKENHGGVNIHPHLPRVMTARELATLQSFPDDFIFQGTKNKQLVQIGNAVPPLLAKAIGLSIRKILEGKNEL